MPWSSVPDSISEPDMMNASRRLKKRMFMFQSKISRTWFLDEKIFYCGDAF